MFQLNLQITAQISRMHKWYKKHEKIYVFVENRNEMSYLFVSSIYLVKL